MAEYTGVWHGTYSAREIRAMQMTSEQKGLLMFCRCRAKKTSILQATGFSLETVLSNRCGQGELRLTETLQ